jgi:predicted TIM-barrel fold metal-dependent hydrolase
LSTKAPVPGTRRFPADRCAAPDHNAGMTAERAHWHRLACRCRAGLPDRDRRRWLFGAAGAAALAACAAPGPPAETAALPPASSAAPARAAADASRGVGRIDVHHHLSPPGWVEALKARGTVDPFIVAWSPERSLADMDRAGVATAMLSITTPGIFMDRLSVDEGRRVARACNEYAAGLASAHPGRFGFFAALPMLDAEGSLREAAYALDVLEADGIGLITSYGDKWLGDPAFFPVLEELDRRRALVYTHPTAASCCAHLQREAPPPMIEFGTDTTRTIASLLFGGAAQRYPNVRWIFSHAGGSMPFLIERFVRQPLLAPQVAPMFPQGVRAVLQRFWYDTAQTANAAAMSALTKVVPVSQIVFGTDFPYRTALDHVDGLRDCGVFDAQDLRRIERETPLSLLPRRRA